MNLLPLGKMLVFQAETGKTKERNVAYIFFGRNQRPPGNMNRDIHNPVMDTFHYGDTYLSREI